MRCRRTGTGPLLTHPTDVHEVVRKCLAGVYTDYAKGAYRAGLVAQAIADTLRAFALSPMGRGRLCLGLLKDFVLRRPI